MKKKNWWSSLVTLKQRCKWESHCTEYSPEYIKYNHNLYLFRHPGTSRFAIAIIARVTLLITIDFKQAQHNAPLAKSKENTTPVKLSYTKKSNMGGG